MQDIKEYLSYDPDTGVFVWIKAKQGARAGSVAGGLSIKGYVRIMYKGKMYLAHRLAWWFVYGEMPDCDIDHKNRIKGDNRIENLRLDTNGDNPHNISRAQRNNTSGYRGVSWNKAISKWKTSIRIERKGKHLGYYDTPEEAYEAYLCAKRELHPFWVEGK